MTPKKVTYTVRHAAFPLTAHIIRPERATAWLDQKLTKRGGFIEEGQEVAIDEIVGLAARVGDGWVNLAVTDLPLDKIMEAWAGTSIWPVRAEVIALDGADIFGEPLLKPDPKNPSVAMGGVVEIYGVQDDAAAINPKFTQWMDITNLQPQLPRYGMDQVGEMIREIVKLRKSFIHISISIE